VTNQSRVFVPVEKIAEFTLKSRAVGALVPSNISSFCDVEFHSDSKGKFCESMVVNRWGFDGSVFMDGTKVKCKISDSNYVQNNVLLYQNSSFYKFKLIYTKYKDYSRSARTTPSVRSTVSLVNLSFFL